MRIHKAIVLLGLAAVLAWGTAASDEPLKVGVVDLEQALSSTTEGKKASEELNRKLQQAESQVSPLIEKYKSLEEEIKSKKFVLSEEALYQKQLDLAGVGNDIQTKRGQLEGDLKIERERMVGPLLKRMGDIVKEIGKDQGYTLIFARGAGGLIYSREAVDITDMVVQKFNEKS
jgi:outer membrane protein